MATRFALPDLFFYRGQLIEIPISQGETEDRWKLRIAYVIQEVNHGVEVPIALRDSREYANEVVLGVKYK